MAESKGTHPHSIRERLEHFGIQKVLDIMKNDPDKIMTVMNWVDRITPDDLLGHPTPCHP